MNSIAHIIHPVMVKPPSDLITAQPITFETMKIAREFAEGTTDVTLLAAQYHDEDRIPLPGCFVRVPDLKRSLADVKAFKEKRKLALIKDILDTLYENSKADYLIYTNVDIALQPYFYQAVSKIIQQGFDAFVINRRSIPDRYSSLSDIPLMYGAIGKKHPGFDCFVFRRELYKELELGQICIGTTKIGVTIITNLICKAKKFKLFEYLHLTFHIGEVREWEQPQFNEYVEHNETQALNIMSKLKDSHSHRFDDSPICQKHYNMMIKKYGPVSPGSAG
jgi:hypothetical protein